MTPRTIQEVSDFFGLIGSVDKYGEPCLFEDIPVLTGCDGTWCGNGYYIPRKLISDADTHDYHILAIPQKERPSYTCPSCGKPLEICHFKNVGTHMKAVLCCKECGKEIPGYILDEMAGLK